MQDNSQSCIAWKKANSSTSWQWQRYHAKIYQSGEKWKYFIFQRNTANPGAVIWKSSDNNLRHTFSNSGWGNGAAELQGSWEANSCGVVEVRSGGLCEWAVRQYLPLSLTSHLPSLTLRVGVISLLSSMVQELKSLHIELSGERSFLLSRARSAVQLDRRGSVSSPVFLFLPRPTFVELH